LIHVLLITTVCVISGIKQITKEFVFSERVTIFIGQHIILHAKQMCSVYMASYVTNISDRMAFSVSLYC